MILNNLIVDFQRMEMFSVSDFQDMRIITFIPILFNVCTLKLGLKNLSGRIHLRKPAYIYSIIYKIPHTHTHTASLQPNPFFLPLFINFSVDFFWAC